MASQLLIDTSVIIDFLRQKEKSKTLLYTLARSEHPLYVAMVTHTELYSGRSVWSSKIAQKELVDILEGLTIIDFTQQISLLAGQLRAINGIHVLDAIIAASAIENSLQLVTLNIKHFEHIQQLTLFPAQ